MNAPSPAVPDAVAPAEPAALCPNCREPLLGEFCYACGQPKKGFIRHLSGIIGDFLDTVFNIDSRTLRTIFPLFFRPGFLSLEYFEGRRVRYVTPLRLYFFFSVLAFLAVAWVTHIDKGSDLIVTDAGVADGNPDELREERRKARVSLQAGKPFMSEEVYQRALKEMEREFDEKIERAAAARAEREAARNGKPKSPPETPPLAAAIVDRVTPTPPRRAGADAAADPTGPADDGGDVVAVGDEDSPMNLRVRRASDRVADRAAAAQERVAAAQERDAANDDDRPRVTFGSGDWDPEKQPIEISWLNAGTNQWLTERARRIVDNAKHIDDDPNRFLGQVFSLAPQTLFVMLPLFALMLKCFYLFKRRLYMEHLIVALHSHSFLCLSILMIALLNLLDGWVDAASAWRMLFDIVETMILWWIPLYLLIAQKRVYGQGWPMTLLKYSAIGFAYTILISFGVVANMMLSLASL